MTGQKFDRAEVRAVLDPSATYIGTGAFGETWRVDGRAMKIIHQDSGVRLQREIDGLSRVAHLNVVQLLGQSRVRLGGEERIVLTFEFIPGLDVEKTITAGSRLPASKTREFLIGALAGGRALHEAGIIHRDLKPANIALRDDDWCQPVLLDLGLAKILDLSSVTNYPALVGTATYMAPEQLSGTRIRKAADVFSLGVVAYEAVTGVHPFYASGSVVTVNDLLSAIQAGPDDALLAGLDERCRSAILQMLSPEEHRRGSAQSLLRQLEG